MTEEQIKLTIGALLHDLGKLAGDGRAKGHFGERGYEYGRNQAGIRDQAVLDCIRYCHGSELESAELAEDSSAYLVAYGDRTAAAADRRETAGGAEAFDRKAPLESIFNILNGNRQRFFLAGRTLDAESGINYPTDQAVCLDEAFYGRILGAITEELRQMAFTEEYVNGLLAVLEANLTYVPASTGAEGLHDISLYDHVKMTAAMALCVQQYLEEQGSQNYREALFERRAEADREKMFFLYSMDISGIQKFIYQIGSKGALKGLRARSFYLEIMMEHMIDELLEKASLSRANLIYSGGGHCYLLLPNTERVKALAEREEREGNRWLLDHFGISLYVAGGGVPCSASDLKNEPNGSYAGLFMELSRLLSGKKAHRYGAEEIRALNGKTSKEERECRICQRMERVNGDGVCPLCAALEAMSGSILYQSLFTVVNQAEPGGLPLPGGCYLTPDTAEGVKRRKEKGSYVRSYTKNQRDPKVPTATRLWVGDYTTGDTFEQFAGKARGIKRIGVLRADVDNLGKAFVYGFHREEQADRYVTLSRTATLSRQLSLFFKFHINRILGQKRRNVTIVYSGGDDLFLVGAWNDVLASFLDLRDALERFTQGTLTISGGVGLYRSGYPINMMAAETAELEDLSKGLSGKNGITLFDGESRYPWTVFREQVMGEKFRTIQNYFGASDERGTAFLYRLLELLRDGGERIQTARYVYLLSRMEPRRDEGKEKWEAYRYFSQKMYEWMKEREDRRQVITAIYLYVYLTRQEKGEEEV